jgi:hypothetical protein
LRRARDPPASAPTGGGTNPSSLSHHRQTTRFLPEPVYYQHHIEAQTGWGIEKFVRDARSYRIVEIGADKDSRTAADPLFPAVAD